MYNNNNFFNGSSLSNHLKALLNILERNVDRVFFDLSLKNDLSVIQEKIYQENSVNHLVINWDKAERLGDCEGEKQRNDYERTVFQKTIVVEIVITFEGNSELFFKSPSNSTGLFPSGKIKGKKLHVFIEYFSDDSDFDLKQAYDEQVNLIQKYVNWVNRDLEKHNQELKNIYIPKEVQKRKAELENSQQKLVDLGIPVRSEKKPEAVKIKKVVKEKKERKVVFSEDYGTVDIYAEDGEHTSESFTPAQAEIVKYIDEAHKKGVTKLLQRTILNAVDSAQVRMADVFKISRDGKTITHPLFNKLICHNNKGIYWLNLLSNSNKK